MKLRISRDMWILGALLALIIVVAYFVGSHQKDTPPGNCISYSPAPFGTKALYTTLGKLGYDTTRHLRPLTEAPSDGVLFILTPTTEIESDELAALKHWVQRGNLLVFAGSNLATNTLERQSSDRERCAPDCPSFLSPDVRWISTAGKDRLAKRWYFGSADISPQPGGG